MPAINIMGVIAMLAKIAVGNVVEDYYIENTHILICDDVCKNRTKEDIDSILFRTGQIATAIKMHSQKGS